MPVNRSHAVGWLSPTALIRVAEILVQRDAWLLLGSDECFVPSGRIYTDWIA